MVFAVPTPGIDISALQGKYCTRFVGCTVTVKIKHKDAFLTDAYINALLGKVTARVPREKSRATRRASSSTQTKRSIR